MRDPYVSLQTTRNGIANGKLLADELAKRTELAIRLWEIEHEGSLGVPLVLIEMIARTAAGCLLELLTDAEVWMTPKEDIEKIKQYNRQIDEARANGQMPPFKAYEPSDDYDYDAEELPETD